MKKVFILMVVVLGIAISTKGQTGNAYVFPVIAGDSLVTADTVFKVIPLTAGYSSFGVQVAIKKATGTLDGKLYLYTSVGGAGTFSYVLTDSASISAVPVNANTANGAYTHTAIIQKTFPAGTRIIAFVTQAGSLTASPTRWTYTARK